ncbi:ABC transporter permease [Alteromonas oceanisediminis]|uniref:ABC transporter permease n=1 Tax=Alteromonas oceanisediminis TaxID=2836180 RepID=UPI001BDA5E0D|nr:ABC transporter permease [Alteromonas oceanisediminis]MBT0587364.1 ABC transporter permease [Alteromonas oceanisediminis]
MISTIALNSLKNRRGAVVLSLLSIFVSVMVLLSVDNIRQQAKDSFGRTVSGVDLIVGARTGQVNLLLYSVFRMGNPTNNISWDSIETLRAAPGVDWVVPISLGDSHRGFRVIGTTDSYFNHFQYGNQRALAFSQGSAFSTPFGAVIGSDVAEQLGYRIADEIVLSHGVGHTSFTHHKHSPFKVVGVLEPTGTPVDKTVHVSLTGLAAAHMQEADVDALVDRLARGETANVEINQVTAAFVGLENRIQALQLQRNINQFDGEPLMAILPGVALAELWQLVGSVENVLLVISALILCSSLLGMATMLLTSIRERQREFAVLRAIGAGPHVVFALIQLEAFLISVVASFAALFAVWLALALGQEWLSHEYGLFIENEVMSLSSLILIGIVCAASFVIACIPAINAFRQSLHQGLSSK